MKKILIAGSTGFLGSKLKDRLLNESDLVVKTINRSSGDYKFRDLDTIEETFDTVFVLFALLPSKDLSLSDYKKINYDLTKQLIEKFPAARFVFSSSISIYENAQEKPCGESSKGLDISDYAQSKLDAESLFCDKDAIILRLSSLYGPGMKENTFLPIVLSSAFDKNEITLIGDSSRKQNYSYIDDVVSFLILAAQSKEQGVFNAVDSKSYSNKELAEIVTKLVADTKIKEIKDERLFYSFEISNEKWMNCFNQESKINLEEGLRSYLEYKLKNKENA